MEGKTIKAINFDIKQNLLDKYYDKSNSTAYYEIEKFMKANGFEHRQGSGYLSKDKIDIEHVYDVIDELNTEFPWTRVCIEKIDVTDKLVEIQNEEFLEDRVVATIVFNEIKDKGYKISPSLANTMMEYYSMNNDIPDLSKIKDLINEEKDIRIKDILKSIDSECERQRKENIKSKYSLRDNNLELENEEDLER